MGIQRTNRFDASKNSKKRLAQIFLKPLVGRNRSFLWLAEAILRPLALLSKPNPPEKTVARILVFEPGGFGDMVLLVPFLRTLRASYPNTRIALLGRAEPCALLLDQGLIDERIPIEMPWGVRLSFWRRHNPFSLQWPKFFLEVFGLRKQRFDLAFAAGWGSDLRGNLIIWLAGASRRVGYGYAGGSFLLTDVAQPDLERPHVADRNLRLLEEIGLLPANRGRVLDVAPEDEAEARRLLAGYGIGEKDLLIGVHPGAGLVIREWGEERFAEVARSVVEEFGAKVLWFSDPLKPRAIPDNLDAIPLSLSSRQFIAVLSRCQLFICNDSGPMHVAAGLNVPVVAVFGPQRPEWFGPRGEGHQVVIRHDMWCRPCAGNCIWGEPYCLRLISVEQVMEAATETLERIVPADKAVEARR